MNEERTRQGNGPARRVTVEPAPRREALGDVARDVMDHLSMMARDRAELTKLEARRYVDHLRGDVAPKAMWGALAGAAALFALVCATIALFWGIAYAIGSVPWTFVIFAALFTIGAVVAAGMAGRPRAVTAEQIERKLPAVRAREHEPEHALARQALPEQHRVVTEEARREAEREVRTSHQAAVTAPDEAARLGGERPRDREVDGAGTHVTRS